MMSTIILYACQKHLYCDKQNCIVSFVHTELLICNTMQTGLYTCMYHNDPYPWPPDTIVIVVAMAAGSQKLHMVCMQCCIYSQPLIVSARLYSNHVNPGLSSCSVHIN